MTETPQEHEEAKKDNSISRVEGFVSKNFVSLLVCLVVGGGALAIFGPWLLYTLGCTGDTDPTLRLHILYMAGGVIAVLGLVETHRKNTVDREKAEVEKDNYKKSQTHQENVLKEQQRQFNETIAKERERVEVDKAKNDQDHTRQVHAERRSRYTTAIEQLSSDKASIRLGGVYSLVGLVDEWLADKKTISDIKEHRKKGQVIINNLCAYIRSPFPLAEQAEQLDGPYAKDLQKNFGGDIEKFNEDKQYFAQEKAALEEERQVRQSIIKEIREHLSKNYSESSSWSDFDYDFSHAHFFYPVNFINRYFGTLLNFSGATFAQEADFSSTTFTQADFSSTTFTGYADFSSTTFTGYADFSSTTFTQNAYFSEATFTQDAYFSKTTFTGYAYFSKTTFTQNAYFSGATFKYEPIFVYTLGNKTYKARFSYKVNPKNYNFVVSPKSCKIETEEQEYNGVKFRVPKGAILFDPDEPSDQEDNNSNDS
ncbi:pentapeptide repeat-containing protein [Rothia dentocariosa]|uniref:pentapeptide repeat-containing protein n=1 Tax=Rothia dentocariosa TaxID=2047 RepID=UPI0028D3AF14|nr:pentapeptide repeat-containing protein [Rothia dentocariosa]